MNEWPGRAVGVFVSVGTGRRPSGTDSTQNLWYEDFLGGDFVDARRRLVAKIEGCEDTHQAMLREHLARRNVDPENYVRLNVEVGVGDFAMNEWHRLADISTSTRRYLAKPDVQKLSHSAAAKLGRIHLAKSRADGSARTARSRPLDDLAESPSQTPYPAFIAELPAEPVIAPQTPRPSYDLNAPPDSLQPPHDPSPRTSDDARRPSSNHSPLSGSPDRFTSYAPTPGQYRAAVAAGGGMDKSALAYVRAEDVGVRWPVEEVPPPVPPKTPIPGLGREREERRVQLPPYPLDEEERPPPVVNMARKPVWEGR